MPTSPRQNSGPPPSPPLILIADDDASLVSGLAQLLTENGYRVHGAGSAEEALLDLWAMPVDLVISDLNMPGTSGIELCREVRASEGQKHLPFILMTGSDAEMERIEGLEAGADDFLSKPMNKEELIARVRTLIRVRSLHQQVEQQARELADWNKELENRVDAQVIQLEKLGRLKQFFAPQIAELIVSDDESSPLRSHRREVTVLFVDLRGFTSFSETAKPEEVMQVLQEYYASVGELAMKEGGTLGHLAGDGIMIFFNDPLDVPDHSTRGIIFALRMREVLRQLQEKWQERGYRLSFGAGLAEGDATLGAIGFREFWEYSVIGSVANLAARLCSEAKPNQILVSHRFLSKTSVENQLSVEKLGELSLKGIGGPVRAFNVLALAGQPE